MAFDLASIALARRNGPLGFFTAVARITALSPLHVLRGKRLLALALVAATPPLLVALLLSLGVRDAIGTETFRVFVSGFYVFGIFPLVCLFVGAAAIGDDIDDGTVLYLRLRPIPRPAIVVGRFFAAVLSALALFIPSLGLLYALQVGGLGDGAGGRYHGMLTGAWIGSAVAAVGYCTIFLVLGLAFRRAVILGIVVILMQGLLVRVPGSAAWLSVNLYVEVVLDHYSVAQEEVTELLMALEEADYLPSYRMALGVVAAGSCALLAFAGSIFSRREYLEKPGD
jgi:ABC-type transport system involved in multi-copper enzyme maturation permease subunit